MAPFAMSGATPMAASTCDFVTLPDEQAEPDETAMPSRSKVISRVSANRPGTAKQVVLGSRSTSPPKITAHLEAAILRLIAQALDISMIFSRARGKTGNGRQDFRCRPCGAVPAAAMNKRFQWQSHRARPARPQPSGTTNLVGGDGHQIDAEQTEIDRNLAEGLDRIGMHEARHGRCASDTISRMGWMTPVSLLASMTLTSAFGLPAICARASRSTTPSGGHRNEFDGLAGRPCGLEHGRMFDRGNQHTLNRRALDRQVVGFACRRR